MIADIVVALILVGGIAWGWKRGFVRSLLSTFSIVISLALAVMLYPVVSNFLADSAITGYVTQNVQQMLGAQSDGGTETGAEEQAPAEQLNLPEQVGKKLADGAGAVQDAVADSIAGGVASLAINVLSILIVFLVVRVGLMLVTALLEHVFRLPVLSTVNRLLGGALGLAGGVLVVYVLLGLLTFVATTDSTNAIVQNVRESRIASQMYDNNIIMKFAFPPGPVDRLE